MTSACSLLMSLFSKLSSSRDDHNAQHLGATFLALKFAANARKEVSHKVALFDPARFELD